MRNQDFFRPRSGGVLAMVALVMPVLMAACTGGAAGVRPTQHPEATIEKRAIERWDRLIAGDLDAAYAYLSPGYRSTYSLEEYRAASRSIIVWMRAEVQKVDCAALESCVATVLVHYKVPMPGAGEVPSRNAREERWIWTENQWYFLPNS